MKYLLALLLVSCAPNLVRPLSDELWPYGQEWNAACKAPMFSLAPPGTPDHEMTSIKPTARADGTCPYAARGVAGYAGDVWAYDCWESQNPSPGERRMVYLHELGHVAGLDHPSDTEIAYDQIMSYMVTDKHTGVTPVDIEQAIQRGWPCLKP